MKIMNLVKANANTTISHEVLADSIIRNANEYDGVRLALVDINLLRIDENYQREIDEAHVNEIANDFNKTYAGCLICSYRNGYFYIIDGQHRYTAALLKGVKTLLCIIYTGLTSKQEAKMFRDLNIKHKRPDAYRLFKANIWNGDKSDHDVFVDMEIKRICDKHNIVVKKVGRYQNEKTLRCLTRARLIVGSTSYNGVECFEWIIDLLNATDWADIHNTYVREVILMLKSFWIDNRNDKALEKKLIEVLNSTTPTLMITKAKHDYPKHGVDVAMGLCLRDMIQGTAQTEIKVFKAA